MAMVHPMHDTQRPRLGHALRLLIAGAFATTGAAHAADAGVDAGAPDSRARCAQDCTHTVPLQMTLGCAMPQTQEACVEKCVQDAAAYAGNALCVDAATQSGQCNRTQCPDSAVECNGSGPGTQWNLDTCTFTDECVTWEARSFLQCSAPKCTPPLSNAAVDAVVAGARAWCTAEDDLGKAASCPKTETINACVMRHVALASAGVQNPKLACIKDIVAPFGACVDECPKEAFRCDADDSDRVDFTQCGFSAECKAVHDDLTACLKLVFGGFGAGSTADAGAADAGAPDPGCESASAEGDPSLTDDAGVVSMNGDASTGQSKAANGCATTAASASAGPSALAFGWAFAMAAGLRARRMRRARPRVG